MEIKGFRGSPEDLQKQFGVSRRLQMRVGALLSKKVDITPTLIECGTNNSPEERLLLHPSLLEKASHLVKESLSEIWDGPSPCPLTVMEGEDGWKTLCFEEELLAREGFQTLSEDPEDSMESLVPALSSPSFSAAPLKGAVFGEEEMEKLRMDILTSATGAVKVEGIRKISLSSLPPKEKALLFLHALGDKNPEVREAVAEALSGLGLSPEITDAMKIFCLNNSSQKVYSLDRLCQYIKSASAVEGAIAFHFLHKILEEEKLPFVIKAICSTLGEVILKVEKPELLLDLAGTLLRLLPGEGQVYEPFFQKLFKSLHRVCPPREFSDFFHRELEITTSPPIAAFLALLMNQFDLGEPSFRAQKLVNLLGEFKESDSHRYRIGKSLVALEEPSLGPLISRYSRTTEGNKSYFIQILDEIGKGLKTPSSLGILGGFFLELIEGEPSLIKKGVYETSLFKRKDYPSEEKGKVARVLLGRLGDFNTPVLQNQLEDFFSNLGEEALSPLWDFINSTLDDHLRNQAIAQLAPVTLHVKKPDQIASILEKLRSFFSKPYVDQGILTITLARICSSSGVSREFVREFTEEILEKLWDTTYDYQILRALGILARSPYFPRNLSERVLGILVEQIDKRPPERVDFEIDEEQVYHHDEEDSEFFTDLVPAALEALKHWATSPLVEEPLRFRVIDKFLEKFRRVKTWKIFWGPYNEARLAQILAEIALSKSCPPSKKEEILRVLKGDADKMYILRFLGQIFEGYPSEEKLGEVAAEMAYVLLKKKVEQKRIDDEINLNLHQVLGILGAHHFLGGEKYDGHKLREAIVQLLFEGMGRRLPNLDGYLEKIADCPTAREEIKKKIRDRLGNLRALRGYGEGGRPYSL